MKEMDAISVLIVVAHPDDEVLGCGGTAAALAGMGIPVRCCFLCGKADARQHRPAVVEFHEDLRRAQEILGLGNPVLGEFPNIHFNCVPHLEMVQFIESAIIETGANFIFTHHPSDLNNDHLHTARACHAAARLFQRRTDVPPLKGLFYMEILSATEWAFPGVASPFQADTFFPVGGTLERKITALRAYRNVMRDFPHPRSEEIVKGLAAYRGGQAGMAYAEAFQTAFHALGTLGGWQSGQERNAI